MGLVGDLVGLRLTGRELLRANRDVFDGLRSESLPEREWDDWLRFTSDLGSLAVEMRSWILSRKRSGAVSSRSADLVCTTGMSSRDARRAVRVADTLDDNAALATALAAGEVTTGHAEALAFAVDRGSRFAANHDVRLVDAAKEQDVDRFRDTLAAWQRAHDGDIDGAGLAKRQHDRRRCAWSTTVDGMVRIDAELAPDAGAVVTGMIGRIAERLWRTRDGRATEPVGDGRTVVQRYADALVELASGRTGGGDGTDGAGRTRADIVCVVDHAWIARQLDEAGAQRFDTAGRNTGLRLPPTADTPPAAVPGAVSGGVFGAAPGAVSGGLPATRRCETVDGVPLTATALRRLACDAGVLPVVMGGNGQVLDLGRTNRTVSPAQRKALIVRDGGCIFPGCDRPASWCDAHHIIHWLDSGPTDLWNLCLLCSAHHHIVHDGGWRLRHLDPLSEQGTGNGRIGFTDPQGRNHEPDRRHRRQPRKPAAA